MINLICFGDSISGGKPDDIKNVWDHIRSLTSYRVRDLSWAGMRLCKAVAPELALSQYLPLGINDVSNIYTRLPAGEEVYVFAQLGVNDIKNNTDIKSIKSQTEAWVDSILCLGSKPVLISPVGNYLEDEEMTALYGQVRDCYEAIATDRSIKHINGRTLIDKDDDTLYALPDPEHLSPLGHIEMANAIILAMEWVI